MPLDFYEFCKYITTRDDIKDIITLAEAMDLYDEIVKDMGFNYDCRAEYVSFGCCNFVAKKTNPTPVS